MACSNCIDGKVSVNQGEGLADCPVCNPMVVDIDEIINNKLSELDNGHYLSNTQKRAALHVAIVEIVNDRIADLESRLEAAEKDAERYRCLRLMEWIDDYIMEFKSIKAGDPKTLDDAIDGYLMKEQSHE